MWYIKYSSGENTRKGLKNSFITTIRSLVNEGKARRLGDQSERILVTDYFAKEKIIERAEHCGMIIDKIEKVNPEDLETQDLVNDGKMNVVIDCVKAFWSMFLDIKKHQKIISPTKEGKGKFNEIYEKYKDEILKVRDVIDI